jgi:hypothetical protein
MSEKRSIFETQLAGEIGQRIRRMIRQGYSNDRIAELTGCNVGDVMYVRTLRDW